MRWRSIVLRRRTCSSAASHLALALAAVLASQASAASPGLVDLYRRAGTRSRSSTIRTGRRASSTSTRASCTGCTARRRLPHRHRLGDGGRRGRHAQPSRRRRARERQALDARPRQSTEVRFRSGDAMLAGTLMVPPGPGRTGVAWVTGSARRRAPTCPTCRRCSSATAWPCSPTTSAASASRPASTRARRRRRARSTCSPATRPRPCTSWRVSRGSIPAASVSPGRARPAGSRRSPPSRERRSASSSSSPGRPSRPTRTTSTRTSRARAARRDEDGRADRRRGAQGRTQRVRPAALAAQAAHPSLWLYGDARPAHPASPLGQRLARDPRRQHHDRRLPEREPRARRDRTGLTAEMLRSDTFAPGLFARVGAWLRAQRLDG